MIAKIKKTKDKSIPAWHAAFLEMLPAIQRQAKIAFRHLDREAREEAVEEVVANALVAYVRLFELGKVELAYPSVLGMYGIRQARAGRRVGGSLNIRDVSSQYCQLRKRLTVERLDKYVRETGEWCEVLVEDRHAGPAETAAARIDVGDWFTAMPRRDREIAEALAVGERTKDVARRFGLSQGRISQKRREYLESWQRFQGELEPNSPAAEVAA